MRIDFRDCRGLARVASMDFGQSDRAGVLCCGFRVFVQAVELGGRLVLSLLILGMLSTPVTSCADDSKAGAPPEPKVSVLQDEYRRFFMIKNDEGSSFAPDYSISFPVMIGEKWAVFHLRAYDGSLSSDWSLFGPEGKFYYRKIQIGSVAVDLESGKAVQFIVRTPGQATPGFIWIDRIYRLPNDRCGVVIGRESPKPNTDVQFFLWEWDLNRNTVAPLGTGDLHGILRSCFTKGNITVEVLNSEKIREPGLQTYRLTDVSSHKSLSIPLPLSASMEPSGSGRFGKYDDSPTLIPLASSKSDSLILYHSYNVILEEQPEVCLECLDPTAPDGRRWKWTSKAIRDVVGEDGFELYLLRRSAINSTTLGLVAHWESREFSTRVLLIDALTGKLLKTVLFPKGYCNNDVLLSHDSKMLGVRNEIPDEIESERDEVTYSLVDVESCLMTHPPVKIPDNVSPSQCFFSARGKSVYVGGECDSKFNT